VKVGDLVRKTYWDNDVGIVVEKPNPTAAYVHREVRVLFEDGLIYQRETELEIVSESR